MEYDAFADALVAGAKSYIDAQFSSVLQRVAALEARSPAEPVPGVGIQSAIRNSGGDLVFVLTDGKLLNVGQIDGKDAPPIEPADIARMIDETVARLPPAAPGKDAPAVPAEAVAAVLKAEIEPVLREVALAAMAALPKAEDGAAADVSEVKRLIGAEVTRQIAALPRPADGKSITVEELVPVIECCVAARPAAKDGVGVTGALIDREGRLVLTLSDGTVKELGIVLGKDADMVALAAMCVREIENIPRPRDGIDGHGINNIDVVYDGEREFVVRFIGDNETKEFPFTLPIPVHREVWKDGRYVRGDYVVRDGSTWHCRRETEGMPGASPDWGLLAKKGRDGKHTETVKYLPATVKLAAESGDGAAT